MSNSVALATVVIMIMNLASRLLGFVRETVIAREFGATYLTDAYNAAYTIPYFLQMVLGMALVTSIVPVVTKYLLVGKEKEAWKIASITLNWTVLLMVVLTVLGVVGSRTVVALLTPGFSGETADLTAILTIIMFPSVVFMGAGMLITGILNARKHFAVAAFAPGFISLVIILSVVFLGRYGVEYLAWGTLAGMTGALIIQLPVLKKVGFKYSWAWDMRHPEVKGIFINLFPIFLGTAVNQLYLAINRYFASGLSEGSISALNYAGKLMNLPMGIFVLAVSSAIFPTLSEQAVQNRREDLGLTLNRGLKTVLLVTLPASAGLMALKVPIVKLLFERGAFDAQATQMTADALFYFSLGMFAMSANMVITRAYYALRDVRTPLVLGVISIAVNIGASIALIPSLSHNGLALANSIAVIFSSASMYLLLRRHLDNLYIKDMSFSIAKYTLASILCAFSAKFIYSRLAGTLFAVASSKALLIEVLAGIAVGVIVYALSIVVLGDEEVLGLLNKIKRRLKH